MATREITYGEAVNEAIRLEMRRDPAVIFMGEDIAGAAGRPQFEGAWGGPFGASRGLVQEFGPVRVLDTPISEMGFTGAAVGAAMTGLRPIADIMFVDFAGVCLDQIVNQAAKMRYMTGGQTPMPLVIRAAIGTRSSPGQIRGGGAAAQHSQILYSIFVHFPGLKCVAPSNPYNAKGLTIAAIRDDDPVVIFDHKFLMGTRGAVPEEAYTVPIGASEVKKQGSDITLIGISRMVYVCMEAAKALEQMGLDAEVIDLLSLAPLDEETILESVRKTKRLVIVDESNPRCSVARDIAAMVADKGFDYLDAPIKTVTAPHTPVPFSALLEEEYVPSPEKVVRTVRDLLGLAED